MTLSDNQIIQTVMDQEEGAQILSAAGAASMAAEDAFQTDPDLERKEIENQGRVVDGQKPANQIDKKILSRWGSGKVRLRFPVDFGQ